MCGCSRERSIPVTVFGPFATAMVRNPEAVRLRIERGGAGKSHTAESGSLPGRAGMWERHHIEIAVRIPDEEDSPAERRWAVSGAASSENPAADMEEGGSSIRRTGTPTSSLLDQWARTDPSLGSLSLARTTFALRKPHGSTRCDHILRYLKDRSTVLHQEGETRKYDVGGPALPGFGAPGARAALAAFLLRAG